MNKLLRSCVAKKGHANAATKLAPLGGGRMNWKQLNAFETYFLLGPSRSLSELARVCNYGFAAVSRWRKQFEWDSLVQERDARALKRLEEINDKHFVENVKVKHIEAYNEVQQKSLAYIRKRGGNFESARDAAVALDIGIKGERECLGLRDTKLRAGIAREGFAAFAELLIGPTVNDAAPA